MCTGDVVRMVCVDGVLEWFCNGVGQGSGSIIDLMGELGRGGGGRHEVAGWVACSHTYKGGWVMQTYACSHVYKGGWVACSHMHAAMFVREGGLHAAMFLKEGGLHAAICMQPCLCGRLGCIVFM